MEIAYDLVSTVFVLLPTLLLLHGVNGSIKIHPQCIENSCYFL